MDFNAEIEAHLQLEIDLLQEQGLSKEEARTAALRTCGSVTRVQERFTKSGHWSGRDHLLQDVRFALRMLARSPGFTAVAVLTLASPSVRTPRFFPQSMRSCDKTAERCGA